MRLLTPALRLPTIYDLPTGWLKERLVQAVITDLDNTLVPWRDYRVADQLAAWFTTLHSEGFRTVILTNARPSPTVEQLSDKLGTELVVGARKPVQRFFRRALEKVGAKPSQACVIGDQVFTDVLGGNLVGCHTVLVERIGDREFAGTRLMRVFERMVLRYLDRK
jgi:HAD superfamily phosphatase (TIGR01668 family)